jgi:hypothetical protein
MRKIALAAAVIGLFVAPALAQAPPAGTPTRVRGTVDKLDGQNLTVKSRDGQALTITLTDNVTVITLVKKSVTDIKAGDYVASTGVKGPDGKIHAVEVRIFPEAARGTGEGQFPWDLMPDSIMTNATVGEGRPGAAGGGAACHLQGRRIRVYRWPGCAGAGQWSRRCQPLEARRRGVRHRAGKRAEGKREKKTGQLDRTDPNQRRLSDSRVVGKPTLILLQRSPSMATLHSFVVTGPKD